MPQIANITGLGDAVEEGGWLQRLTVFLYRVGLAKAKRVFFQNEANMEFCLKHGIGKGKGRLLPGSGVNLSYHALQPYPNEAFPVKILFIGRVLKTKGVEEYFEAAKAVAGMGLKAEFSLLGPCEIGNEALLKTMVDSEVINYLGATSDIRPFLKDVHATVLPSYHEGMSNVNLESAAAGRPVITTDIPGCRETVDDGVTGFLVKPRDAKDLTNKLVNFINLPYSQKAQMGLAGRAKVEREFDRNIVVEAYLKEVADSED